jgi:hypothetical protein
MGSNPDEAIDFKGDKIMQHIFLQKGSSSVRRTSLLTCFLLLTMGNLQNFQHIVSLNETDFFV